MKYMLESKIVIVKNSNGSYMGRVPIRKTWLDKLGITPNEREITTELKKDRIIVKKSVKK